MSILPEDAKDAAQQQNWSQLNRYLEQLLPSDFAESESATPEMPLETGQARSLTLCLQVLEWGDFQAKWEVAKLLPVLGEAAIAPLMNLLQDEDAELESRWFAARILGEFDHPEVVQALIDILQSAEDEDLTGIAAETLASLGASAITALASLLADEATRLPAVQSLAQIRHSSTIEPLLSVVEDPQPAIRALAIEALGTFHDTRIPPILIRALQDPFAPVRQAAIQGLSVRANLATDLDLITPLADRLSDSNQSVCQQAALALGRLGTEAASAALFQALQSPNTPIDLQIELVRALSWTETADHLNYLQQALSWLETSEQTHLVYQEIVTCLGRWSASELQPQVAAILTANLQSDQVVVQQPSVKQAISLALGQLGQPEAMDALIQLLADDDASVRLHAIAALKALNSQQARQQLEVLAARDDIPESLQRGVTIALQEWEL